jgi:hypothetical protein
MFVIYVFWRSKMIKTSNYYEQSMELPAQNSFQLMLLQLTDATTLLREGSKMGTVIGLVSLAASAVFNFNPSPALTCTVVSGLAWVLSRTCAQKLEPQAQDMIQHFVNIRDGKEM